MRKATSVTALVTLFAIALLLVASPLSGQEKAEETEPGWITKSFQVKHVKVEQLHSLFQNLPSKLRSDRELGILVVYAPPQTMAFIDDTIAQLDVPAQEPASQSNVKLTVYLLGGTRQESTDSEVIPVLEPVVNELRQRFPYHSYRLLESAVLRLRSNSKGEASGTIPGFLPDQHSSTPTLYTIRADLRGVSTGVRERKISLGGFSLSIRLPIITSLKGTPPERTQLQYQDIGIDTQLDIREGETVVVGKAGVQGTVDGVFLILRADLVD